MSLQPRSVDFAETWSSLQETVKGVLTLGHVPRATWNDRFSDVYSLCVAYPESLADRLYEETMNYLHKHVAELLEKVKSDGDGMLLKNYYGAWSEFSQGVTYLHRLYLYLNRQHIKRRKMSVADSIIADPTDNSEEGQMEIGELGLEVWKVGMIIPLGQRIVKLLLEAIEHDRVEQVSTTPVDVIKGTIISFVQVEEYKKLGGLLLYQKLFEEAFLEASGEYYQREASRLLQECNVSSYIYRVIAKMEEESQRARRFLHYSSLNKVRQKCEAYMVAEHLGFIYSECATMVKEERCEDLANMHNLLKSVQNGVSVLVDTVLEHIRNQGLQTINNLNGDNTPTKFVDSVLAVHVRYKSLIQNVFNGDQCFIGALDKACSTVVNHRADEKQLCRSPELLAKYCDCLLKKTSKGTSEADVEEKLSQSIIIFKYIDDKDVFQKFYSKMLARRLIHQQSQSMDAEEAMINRLKQICGYEFTSKLHRMFTDMSVSADLNNKFNAFLKQEKIELGVSFGIHVLQAGAWPVGQMAVPSFALPQQLEKSVQMFELFYHNHFSGRKLTWLHNLCQAELKLCYLKRPYLVTVQTFQMAVLLPFETADELICKELRETLQLSSEQFQKHATSLVECKLILCDTAELVPESLLRLNMNYSNKRTKIRITPTVQKDSPQEDEHTFNTVEEDRKLFLQAAIVRIMKARKVLRHNDLIQEICSQSRVSFTPSIAMIKKCIEVLIDKQYIERTASCAEEYSYVA